MEIAYNLYRVSTKKQVDKNGDDIPMQKKACRDFARQMGWTVGKEYEEKGISGFKVSAQNRDAIQELKEAALRGEFHILLVFMFDRIGRIDDETPFVVEWFAKHGVRVWSVKEGEQRFESHTDKLTNYIRFWQASGESEKTSMRIKTRMRQLTLDGQYTGGVIPYGYQRVKTGKINKKGHDVYDIAIEPEEAEVVRMIFRMTITDGYGSHQMASYLNSHGYKTHKGSKFQCNTVLRILKNKIYCGYLISGDVSSDFLPRIKIIEQSDYDMAQKIIAQRDVKNREKSQIALNNKGNGMISGNAYCAHCGGKLTTTRHIDKYVRKDGTEYKQAHIKYLCSYKARKLCECDGQTTYKAERVDKIITEFIENIFQKFKGSPEIEKIQAIQRHRLASDEAKIKKLQAQILKDKKQLETLKLEIANCLLGDSVFTKEDIVDGMNTLKERIASAEEELSEVKNHCSNDKRLKEDIIPTFHQFKSWAEEFSTATLSQKKMIAGQLFNRIEIGKDYKINFVINTTYQDFCKF